MCSIISVGNAGTGEATVPVFSHTNVMQAEPAALQLTANARVLAKAC